MIQDFNLSTEYARALFKHDDEIEAVRQDALCNNVPIISEEALSLLIFLLNSNNYKNALEIGSATGYSGLYISKYLKLTTIEIDESRYNIAKANFEKYNRDVTIYKGDAIEILDEIQENFDFIFIDASKGQYMKFFEKSYPKLNKNGIIFIDNILFRSYVCTDDPPKKYKTIAKKLNEFIIYLNENHNLVLLPLADGVGIIRKD